MRRKLKEDSTRDAALLHPARTTRLSDARSKKELRLCRASSPFSGAGLSPDKWNHDYKRAQILTCLSVHHLITRMTHGLIGDWMGLFVSLDFSRAAGDVEATSHQLLLGMPLVVRDRIVIADPKAH